MLMLSSEWYAFEAMTIMAGILGVLELASQTIYIQVIATMFMVPLGINEATTGIIGNCIGAGNVPLAKRFFKLITCVTESLILTLSAISLLFRKQITGCFTDDPELAEMTQTVLIVCACVFLFDGTQGYL